MVMRNPPSYLAAATQQHTAQNDRLTQAAAYRTLDGVRSVSGVLAGPAGTMGELTLVSDTVLRVNPFRAAIQSTQDSKQGAYTVTNDEAVNLTVTGRHASQYRRSLVLVYVADSVVSGVASSGTTDGTFLTILDGTLAASNPQLPSAVPPNALLLGEVSIPPVGVGSVTMTPYNPRTTLRGGILPVLASDTVQGLSLGEYRDHPTLGLQRWDGAGWAGADVPVFSPVTFSSNIYTSDVNTSPCGALLYANGRVAMHGSVTNGVTPFNAAAGSVFTVGTLPAPVRPAKTHRFTLPTSGGQANTGFGTTYLEVRNTGELVYVPAIALGVGFVFDFSPATWQRGY